MNKIISIISLQLLLVTNNAIAQTKKPLKWQELD